ncbi:MAG TPA: peptidase, partial [Luteimonas sp.]|nr:peptidase [Luteimonas sp.]
MPPIRRFLRWALLGFAALTVLGALGAGVLIYVVSSGLPDVQSLRHVALQEPMYVHARDGKLMAIFGESRRYPVEIARVPARVKQAFIAIE